MKKEKCGHCNSWMDKKEKEVPCPYDEDINREIRYCGCCESCKE